MIVFKDYPYWNPASLQDVFDQLRQIASIRKDDIIQINNINNSFIDGRKTAKIPLNSVDVSLTDRVGDFNVTPSYAYFLIDNAGTAEWRRAALSTF